MSKRFGWNSKTKYSRSHLLVRNMYISYRRFLIGISMQENQAFMQENQTAMQENQTAMQENQIDISLACTS